MMITQIRKTIFQTIDWVIENIVILRRSFPPNRPVICVKG